MVQIITMSDIEVARFCVFSSFKPQFTFLACRKKLEFLTNLKFEI